MEEPGAKEVLVSIWPENKKLISLISLVIMLETLHVGVYMYCMSKG